MKQQQKRKASVTSLQGKPEKKRQKQNDAENTENPESFQKEPDQHEEKKKISKHMTREKVEKKRPKAKAKKEPKSTKSSKQKTHESLDSGVKEKENGAGTSTEHAEVAAKVKEEPTVDVIKEEPPTKKAKAKKKPAGKKAKATKEEAPENTELEEKKVASRTMKRALPVRSSRLSEKWGKTNKFVGAHTSISGGLKNAVYEAMAMGARAFGLFLKNQRSWNYKPLEEKQVKEFKQAMEECEFPARMVVPHGSYLMNCGAPNDETLVKSRASLIDCLQRCERLGLPIFNFHPGSTCKKMPTEKCIGLIAESINIAHSKTSSVIAVLENMSCQGGTIGGKFSELASIIEQVTDKNRVGVCLDTCHAFAAGYDLRTEKGYNAMMEEFDQVIGLQYLKAVHLNDSQGKLGCHLDRHENIGRGEIGRNAFRYLMNDDRFNSIPCILETPQSDDMGYELEIKQLYKLCKD